MVDAAQSAAHLPLTVDPGDPEAALDVVVLSGHKIYTPGSPGVLMARKELFLGQEPEEVGGGIVSFVDTSRYEILPHLPEREEAGTPNLPGAIALGATLRLLQHIGMDLIAEDERRLTQYALDRLSQIPRLHIYGSHRLEIAERIGVITFNLYDLPHGLVTAALNDYFGIAVRNECFCAQPFVRQLLGIADAEGGRPIAASTPARPASNRAWCASRWASTTRPTTSTRPSRRSPIWPGVPTSTDSSMSPYPVAGATGATGAFALSRNRCFPSNRRSGN